MEYGRHFEYGVGNPNQDSGKHRINEMSHGVGFIPLGDRNRDRFYGDDILEERQSLGLYDKFFK